MQSAISKYCKSHRRKPINDVEKDYITCMRNINQSLESISMRNSSAIAVNSLRDRIRASVSLCKPRALLQRPYSPYSNRTLMKYIHKKQINGDTIEPPRIPECRNHCKRSMMAYKSYNLNKKIEQPTVKTITITAPSIRNIYGMRNKARRRILKLMANTDIADVQ